MKCIIDMNFINLWSFVKSTLFLITLSLPELLDTITRTWWSICLSINVFFFSVEKIVGTLTSAKIVFLVVTALFGSPVEKISETNWMESVVGDIVLLCLIEVVDETDLVVGEVEVWTLEGGNVEEIWVVLEFDEVVKVGAGTSELGGGEDWVKLVVIEKSTGPSVITFDFVGTKALLGLGLLKVDELGLVIFALCNKSVQKK